MSEPAVLERGDAPIEAVEALQPADEQPVDAVDTAADASDVDERIDYLRSLSAEDLLELHPGLKRKVATLVGNHAQKQAKELVAKELPGLAQSIQAQLIANIRHAAEYDRLERLRTTDQWAFAEEMTDPNKLAIMAAGRQRPQEQVDSAGQFPPDHIQWRDTVERAKMQRLSNQAQAVLMKKSWPVSAAGRAAFEDEADKMWLEEQIEKSLSTKEQATKKRAAAEGLDSLAEEPGEIPEVGTARSRGGIMTISQYDGMSNTQKIAYRKNNPDAYNRMINRAYQARA